MHVRCCNLRVTFEAQARHVVAVDDLSFDTAEGEFVSIIGPSGCGKTTLLRALAGLLQPESGSIEFHPDSSPGLLVFQENSLFPWMTALENAAFGMEMLGKPRHIREQAARELLARYGLAGRENAYPNQLSAGMKQRVAVIRAFLSEAPVLLMDEPFAALDSQTRAQLQTELLALWTKDRKTVIFVTHDVDEALYLSDRILVLSPQPARIVDTIAVPFSRAERYDAVLGEEFIPLKRQILARIGLNWRAPCGV